MCNFLIVFIYGLETHRKTVLTDFLAYDIINSYLGFPGGLVVRNPLAKAGDVGSILG